MLCCLGHYLVPARPQRVRAYRGRDANRTAAVAVAPVVAGRNQDWTLGMLTWSSESAWADMVARYVCVLP